MSKWPRRLMWTLVLVLAIGGPAYYLLVLYSPQPTEPAYTLDIAAVRKLADSLPGDKPHEVRYEHIMDFEFAQAMVVAGDPWRGTPIPVYSYQLVYPDQTVIIDSAMPRAIAKPDFIVHNYDEAAFARMSQALDQAALIVITHEHMDHIGGIAAHADISRLLPALRLTTEQVANPKGMAPAVLAPALLQQIKPLQYDGMLAIAPGVVLIKSPGHTPGSQIVYVQRADGRELLLLGDIAWHQRNIDLVRERPLFMTTLIGENRQQILAEYQALHQLAISEPAVKQVPGHDGEVVRALTDAGLLTAGFKPTP